MIKYSLSITKTSWTMSAGQYSSPYTAEKKTKMKNNYIHRLTWQPQCT